MHFQRYGTSYHPILRYAEDLREACDLDKSLWVATSAPLHAFRIDPEFLRHLDKDKDGRVKCGELVDAIRWTRDVLDDFTGFDGKSDILRAGDLGDHPDARDIKFLLEKIGGATEGVSLKRIRDCRAELESRPVSEAGVVLPDATEDPDLKSRLEDLLRVWPGADHPSGRKGVDLACLRDFRAAARERIAWRERLNQTDDLGRSLILPLGDDTASAFHAYQNIRERLDHYFRLCDVVAHDAGQMPRIWPGIPDDVDWDDPAALRDATRQAPLARPNTDRVLKFDGPLNPAWERELHDFRQRVVVPLLDRTDDVMTLQIWNTIRERLAPHADWIAEEPFSNLAPLSDDRLRDLLEEERLHAVETLIATQADAAVSLSQVRKAEKLSLYQAHLLNFANNFIAFPFLYDPDARAGFEMGTLIMDGRRFNLAVNVPDRAAYLKHIAEGHMFIMIVELTHAQRGEKMDVAVPATSGHQGNLRVGKHGVFRHVDGSQWFATVVHITDNSVSLAEAVVEPFKRLAAAVTQKVETLTRAAETKLDQSGAQAVSHLQQPPPAAPSPGGMLAGGGIAIAALGSSLAFITKTFSNLHPLGIVKGLVIAILAVLIPGTLVAWIRLRKRDLSVLLEGAGWAVNSRMRLGATQSRAFTQKPRFPEGSRLRRGREWWLWRLLWATILLTLLLYLV